MSESRLGGVQHCCRTCLSLYRAADMTSVHTLEPTLHVTYSVIIEAVTGLDMSKDACKLQNFKMYLCPSCKSSATSAYEYKLMAIRADQQLRTGTVDNDVEDKCDEDKATVKQDDQRSVRTGRSKYNDEKIKHKVEVKLELFECDGDMFDSPCSPVGDYGGIIKQEVTLTYDATKITHECGICGKFLNSTSSLEKHTAGCSKAESKLAVFKKYKNSPDPYKNNGKPKREPSKLSQKNEKNQRSEAAAVREKSSPACYVHHQSRYPWCGVCDGVSVTDRKLLEHYSECHYGTCVTLCPLCNKLFTQVECLRRHLLVAHAQEEAAIPTMLAQATNTTVESLLDTRFDSEELYLSVCPQCSELTMSSQALQQHNSSEHPAFGLSCKLCNKIFLNLKGFKLHNRPCYKRFRHTCGICKERFIYRRMMENHVKSQHSDDPIVTEAAKGNAWRCSVCGQVFKTHWRLLTHEGTHGLRRREQYFECDSCNQRFGRKGKLIRHLNKHDRGKREPAPLSLCAICGQSVYCLAQHVTRKHRVGKFSCQHCDKEFIRSDYLKSHQRVHSGEKPHTCSDCGKQFARMDGLKRHTLIHTGHKPYACKHCGRKFTQSEDRRRHELRHTGEKPFNCTHCGEGFDKAKDLKKHQEDCS